jgi:hypothetical protein
MITRLKKVRRQGTSFYALVDNVPYTLVGVYCIEVRRLFIRVATHVSRLPIQKYLTIHFSVLVSIYCTMYHNHYDEIKFCCTATLIIQINKNKRLVV